MLIFVPVIVAANLFCSLFSFTEHNSILRYNENNYCWIPFYITFNLTVETIGHMLTNLSLIIQI